MARYLARHHGCVPAAMHNSLPIVLALGLSLGPRVLLAAPTEPGIAIHVDAVDLPDARAELPSILATSLAELLAGQEQQAPGVVASDDRRLLVELRPGPIPGSEDLLIHVLVVLDDEAIAESATETCIACNDDQVAEKALALLEPLLTSLPAPAQADEPPAPQLMDQPAPRKEEQTAASQSRAKHLVPGASLLGVGVVGIGVGVALIATNERVVSGAGALDLEVVKYREPGIAIAVIGGALVITGAVLLGLAANHRGEASSRTARLVADGNGLGIAF